MKRGREDVLEGIGREFKGRMGKIEFDKILMTGERKHAPPRRRKNKNHQTNKPTFTP